MAANSSSCIGTDPLADPNSHSNSTTPPAVIVSALPADNLNSTAGTSAARPTSPNAPAGACENPPEETDPSLSLSKGPRRRWSLQDDYIVLKEIVNAQAHVSPWGKMTARYQQAADKFNSDPTTRWETDHKHVKDRFFRLKDNFEKLDKTRRDKSGVEEELTPTEKLLVTMVKECDAHKERTDAERKEKTATEEELTRKGGVVRDLAMACRTEGAASGTSALEAVNDKGGSNKTRARSRARTQADNGDDEEIVALLERAEARKEELASRELSLREQQLAHDRALLDEARQRRAEDRAERLRREAQDTDAAETARVERAALTRALEALANSKTSSGN